MTLRAALRVLLRLTWATTRRRALVLGLVATLQGACIPLGSLASQRVVDSIESDGHVYVFAIAFVATVYGAYALAGVRNLLTMDLGDRVGRDFEDQVLGAVAGATGLEHLESEEYARRLSFVQLRSFLPWSLVLASTQQLSNGVSLFLSLFVVATVHPSLLLPVLLTIPAAYAHLKAGRAVEAAGHHVVPLQRIEQVYADLAVDAGAAKEIRVFGSAQLLRERHFSAASATIRAETRARARGALVTAGTAMLQGVALAITVVWTIALARAGQASRGDVFMVALLAQGVFLNINSTLGMLTVFGGAAELIDNFLYLVNYKSPVRADGGVRLSRQEAVQSIQFEGVSHMYPGSDAEVLHDVSLTIKPGSTVALVGENGAGKTTLAKLLMRYYEPTRGRVVVGDLSLADVDVDAWRSHVSAVFQDYAVFKFLVRESVGLGDVARINHVNAVEAAIARAGLSDTVVSLPDGVETQLGAEFPGGVELSQGQHQGIAVARSAMRERPVVLVLDEPSSSLDPLAEANVFRRFREAFAVSDDDKPTCLFISHRFSAVREADKIVVIHRGRIEEVGSHDELIRARGRYSELYALQASKYD